MRKKRLSTGESLRDDDAVRHQGNRKTAIYFATGIVNSAPLAMLSGQRCITLL